MFKILRIDEIEKIEKYVDSYYIKCILNGHIDKFESHKKMNLISFDWHDLNNPTSDSSQIIIYFSTDNLFFLCEDEQTMAMIKKIIKKDDMLDKTLYNFFAELISSDTRYLENLEEEITETEDELLTSSKKECTKEIISYRRELLNLKRYYEQLNTIFEGLVENENKLISEDNLRYFIILDGRIDRLFANVLNIRDYVTQVREAYQAQIDIEQNNLMRIFTVVTSIFLPLTLIVGWYGMNLQMPEYTWKFGYLFVIILSILITTFCLALFKRKKWF